MANENAKIKYDMTNLENIVRSLKQDYVLRVGILGSKAKGNHDSESGLTNAEIGTVHEFGSGNVPRRSFLEDSLKYKLKFNTEQFKKLKRVLFKQFFVKNAPQVFLQDLGAKCLEIIEEGFATNGFGMWKSLSAATYAARAKKAKIDTSKATKRSLNYWFNHPILTDTGKLRKSISFKVIKRK